MSIYMIVPEKKVSTSVVKVGMTKNNRKKNTTKNGKKKRSVYSYLYSRYHTSEGDSTIYVWDCPNYIEMEKQIFKHFDSYRIQGTEKFKGSWHTNMAKKIIAYNCVNISRNYHVYKDKKVEAKYHGRWYLFGW